MPGEVQVEILVVDNGSTDRTAGVVEEARRSDPRIRYLAEPHPGQSRARNAGLRAVASEAVVFIDDDVQIASPQSWLSQLCGPILAGLADAAAGAVRVAPSLCRPWMTAFHRSLLASTERLEAGGPVELVGANMAFARRVLERVPGFDEELGPGALGFGDDSLFSWQLVEAGYRLTSAFDAVVEHHPDPRRLTRAALLEAARAFGRTRGYYQYHWLHERLGMKGLHALKRPLRLWWTRLRRRPWREPEGAPQWELELLADICALRYFVAQTILRRPRKYARRGLVKRT